DQFEAIDFFRVDALATLFRANRAVEIPAGTAARHPQPVDFELVRSGERRRIDKKIGRKALAAYRQLGSRHLRRKRESVAADALRAAQRGGSRFEPAGKARDFLSFIGRRRIQPYGKRD